MKRIDSKEKTVHYKTEKYELCDDINLVIEYTNNKIVSQVIPCNFKHSNDFIYALDINNFIELFRTKYFIDALKVYKDYVVNDYKSYFANNEFNKDNLFGICAYDHTLINYKNEKVPILRHVDYISGFIQREFCDDNRYGYFWKWKELKTFLSSHKDVLNFEEITIPYFNSDFEGQKAFEFDVIYPDSCGYDAMTKMINFLGIDVSKLVRI